MISKIIEFMKQGNMQSLHLDVIMDEDSWSPRLSIKNKKYNFNSDETNSENEIVISFELFNEADRNFQSNFGITTECYKEIEEEIDKMILNRN